MMDETKLREILQNLYESGVIEGDPSPGEGVNDYLGSVDAALAEIQALFPTKIPVHEPEELAEVLDQPLDLNLKGDV